MKEQREVERSAEDCAPRETELREPEYVLQPFEAPRGYSPERESSDKIKVLLLLTSTAGGAGEQAYQLARSLPRSDFDVTVGFGPGYPLDESFARLGLQVRTLSLSRRISPLTNLRGLLQIYRMLKVEHFDMVCTSCSIAGLFGRLAASAAGVGVIVHIIQVYASRPFQPPPRRAIYRWIERGLDRLTSKYVAVSGAVKRYGVETGIMPPEKVEVIFNAAELPGVAASASREVRSEFGIPSGAHVVGTLGRYEPQKGIEYFLRAAAIVLETRSDTHFLVVGDGPLRGELEDLARELGIDAAVHFTGWRTDVPEVLGAMNVFGLASLWETFGIVLAEAMLAGLPVVATRVDGIPEVVADGETGYLVSPRDEQELALRLLQFLEEPDLARRMGRAGRTRAETRFSVDTMVRGYERLFHTLLPHKCPPLQQHDSARTGTHVAAARR